MVVKAAKERDGGGDSDGSKERGGAGSCHRSGERDSGGSSDRSRECNRAATVDREDTRAECGGSNCYIRECLIFCRPQAGPALVCRYPSLFIFTQDHSTFRFR